MAIKGQIESFLDTHLQPLCSRMRVTFGTFDTASPKGEKVDRAAARRPGWYLKSDFEKDRKGRPQMRDWFGLRTCCVDRSDVV